MDNNTDNLSPFDRFQLERYGNILPVQGTILQRLNISEDKHDQEMSQAEANYIFQLENPK